KNRSPSLMHISGLTRGSPLRRPVVVSSIIGCLNMRPAILTPVRRYRDVWRPLATRKRASLTAERSMVRFTPGPRAPARPGDGPGRRLQPAVLEALHLVVEAFAQAAFAADEVGGGDEPVVEGHLVGVHAPVAERVDRPALHLAAALLGELEVVAGRFGFLDD